MPFVADDLAAWLVGLLADAGRRRLTTWVLGSDQERALRQAAAAAVGLMAEELRPQGGAQAEELAMVVSHVFSEPVPDSVPGAATLLEALQAGVAGQLAVLDDADLTGTGRSSAEVLGLPVRSLAESLTGHLMREIVVRGSRGGPLEPLAAQLNHDVTHLQGQRLEEMVGQLASELRAALARPEAGSRPPPATLAVRYSLPPDAAAFTGRDEELSLVCAAAADVAAASAVVAIQATPGAGKTALAVHAAHLLKDQFPDRQLFIDLHAHTPGQEPVLPEAALSGLLTAIGVDTGYLPEDLAGRVGLWRDRMAGQRAVLVLDNAAGSDQVRPLLPGGGGSLALITSRRYLGDLPAAAIPILLEPLPPDAAQAMFRRLASRAVEGPDRAVADLAWLAGYLPLAISLLARVYTRHPSWTLADLVHETKVSLLTMAAETDTVAAAFELSYWYLDPGQQQFFRCLGLHPGTTIDAYASAALAGIPLAQAGRHLDALQGEGLLTEVGYRRYGMHDLIRLYARELATTEPEAVRDQSLAHVVDYYQHAASLAEARLARHAQTRPTASAPESRPAALPGLPDRAQALAWARAERANLLTCLDRATRDGQDARIVGLTAGVAALLRQDGPWNDAITRHAAAIRAAQRLGDRLSEANALGNLGAVRQLTGDYRGATEALQAALDIARDIGDRLGQAYALNHLGLVRYLMGDYPGATRALGEALDICRDIDDQLGQAYALDHLGVVAKQTGDFPDAAQAHEAALAIYRDLGDQWGEGTTLDHLGVVRWMTGDYPGATEALQAALDIARDIGDRRGQANALTDLGEVRRMTGDYPGAAQAHEAALSIARDIGDRLGVSNALIGLGSTLRLTGDYPGAARALREALGMSRETGDRAGEMVALGVLGIVLRLTGDYPGAADALEKALDMCRELGDRGGEAELLNEMGTLHRVRGDLDLAVAWHRQALDLAREIDSAWDEASALAGLGRCALAADGTAEARDRLRQAAEIFQRIGAAEASDVSAELDAIT